MINSRPEYLNGALGIVVKINRTRVVINLEKSHGKWQYGIRTPIEMLEVVE